MRCNFETMRHSDDAEKVSVRIQPGIDTKKVGLSASAEEVFLANSGFGSISERVPRCRPRQPFAAPCPTAIPCDLLLRNPCWWAAAADAAMPREGGADLDPSPGPDAARIRAGYGHLTHVCAATASFRPV